MELKTPEGFHLISEEEKKKYDELSSLAKVIKNKYFSLGRDLDKFVKLTENK